MSMYQHAAPQSYGHPYPPPPSHNYVQHHAQYPVPAYSYPHSSYPMPPSDPSSFRRDFTARLAELTINSRPIIQSLSMMAQGYTRYSDIVADCLQAHIRRVSIFSQALYSGRPLPRPFSLVSLGGMRVFGTLACTGSKLHVTCCPVDRLFVEVEKRCALRSSSRTKCSISKKKSK